jgi:outer membrane protein TolC
MSQNRFTRRPGRALAATATLLAGCAHYAPLPLATQPHLASSVAELQGTPGAAPLTIDQVVALALANNPDLQALRLKVSIAREQLGQARILPNPTLTGAFLPLISGVGSVPAWNIGLSQNIRAIVTYRSRQRAAGEAVKQIGADTVWQEWQVAGQARQLAANLIHGARSRPTYVAAYELLADRNSKLDAALAAGNVTLATAAPDRVALQAARTALNMLDQRQLSLTHQLDALLGLSPDVAPQLAATVDLPPFDPAAVRAELKSLPDRRPDLLALRMGYAQTDEQVRAAILSQFPDLVLGASGSSDNMSVINGGPSLSVGLPVFDRNQGAIAVAKATRAQLHADYAARLASATGQVEATLAEMGQLSAQLATARRDLPAARLAADNAVEAFGAANLDERGYVDLVVNRFTREQDIMTLELALLDRQIALQTLIGAGLPTVDTLSDAVARAQP